MQESLSSQRFWKKFTGIEEHLVSNNMHEIYQSAHWVNHSTETALLKMHRDIISALESNSCVVLLMLDFQASDKNLTLTTDIKE